MTAADAGRALPGPARFDRSVAFWLRAYPRRWRAARAAEITAVVTDLAEPGARRLDARAALGLVRGGWATRWREHPPLGVWLMYRLLDRPVPDRYRAWVRDDINGRLFGPRRVLWSIAVIWVFWAAWLPVQGAGSAGWMYVLGAPPLAVAVGTVKSRWLRRRATSQHLALRAGEPVVSGVPFTGRIPRRRLDARAGLAGAAVILGVAAVAWGIAALTVPEMLVLTPCAAADVPPGTYDCWTGDAGSAAPARPVLGVVLAVAAVAGLLLVPLVRRRLRRLMRACPPQPDREIVPMTAERWGVVISSAVLIATEAWAEASGRWVLVLSGILGPVAVLLLPGTIAALLVVRRLASAAGLSTSDVRAIVIGGRLPDVDLRHWGVTQVDGPVAPGAVVPTHGFLFGPPGEPYSRHVEHGQLEPWDLDGSHGRSGPPRR